MNLTKINQERWDRFRANKRGYLSLYLFSILFVLTLFSELISNDKPLLIYYDS
ncbi:MAG: ABC transporter permease, partial [Proteobacteria bacterium]|nr:ABC transporter permease [Pseudomonadota bacterium]